ncbi:MAG: hypothetical protein Q9198_008077 [Flavoplaca austrocitrina]
MVGAQSRPPGLALISCPSKSASGSHLLWFRGNAVIDPIDTPAGAGVDAFRVQAFLEQCNLTEPFAPSASHMDDEDDFFLGFECIDVKVEIAQQAVALADEDAAYHQPGLNIPKGI